MGTPGRGGMPVYVPSCFFFGPCSIQHPPKPNVHNRPVRPRKYLGPVFFLSLNPLDVKCLSSFLLAQGAVGFNLLTTICTNKPDGPIRLSRVAVLPLKVETDNVCVRHLNILGSWEGSSGRLKEVR